MLREDQQKPSLCSEALTNLKKVFSICFQKSQSGQTSSSSSPQTFMYGQNGNKNNIEKDKLKSFSLNDGQITKSWQQMAIKQAKIRGIIINYGFFLICQIAVFVACFYLENLKNESNQNNGNFYLLFVLLNVLMVCLVVLIQYLLKYNTEEIENEPPFIQSNPRIIQLLIFFFFTTLALVKGYLYQNQQIANLEILVCVLLHEACQQDSQFFQKLFQLIVVVFIIIKLTINQSVVQDIICALFLLPSLIIFYQRCNQSISICACKITKSQLDENRANNKDNQNKIQNEIQGNCLIQSILNTKKGICCLKCARPHKIFIENITQIDNEIGQILEENSSLKFILNQIPQGFCKVDKKTSKISICNYQVLNKSNIFDKETLLKVMSDLRIQITSIISQTETTNTNQNNVQNNSTAKINQKMNQKSNLEKLNEYLSQHKALSNSQFQKKNNLFPFLQFHTNNNLIQNNLLTTPNNKQNYSQISQFEQQVHIINNLYDDDNASVINQNNLQNNANGFHYSQYSQLEDFNTKRISDVSKKSQKQALIKQSGNMNSALQANNNGITNHNNQSQSNHENVIKLSGIQDENNNQQTQLTSNDYQNQQYQILFMKQNLLQNEKQFPSSDVCSFNFSNFEASPMQNNKYFSMDRDSNSNTNQFQKINVKQSDFYSTSKTKQLNTSQNDQIVNERTEEAFLQQSFPMQIILNKQASQTNNHNLNEFDSSNFNLLDQKTIGNKTPILDINYKFPLQPPHSDSIQQSSQQSQQLPQNNKQNNREFINKENNFDSSKFDRFQTKYNSMQVNTKQNYNINQMNSRRKNSIRQDVNRKRVLTDNVLTQMRRDSQFMNQFRNDKKDINTTNSYNINFHQNNYNSNSLGAQLNNLIDQDIQNLNILTLDEVMNIPVLQYNVQYSLKLSDPFGEFTSVKLIKQNDQSFYFLFDDFEDKILIEQELLKELENFQTKVLKSISHEFGTPLNCAINMLKMCSLKVEKELNTKYIHPALSSIRILKFSCSDFIDYAKIQFNCFKLDIRKTDLRHLLKKVIEYFQPLVESQKEGKEGIQLIFLEDPQVPDYIMSDPSRIMQVIFNLLTNSLKFTQKGFIKIKATYISQEEIEISVQDSGIGIQIDQQENLFERKTIKNKKQETSGLGLIISNALAQRLSFQGQGLNLQSKIGEGSLFSFNIHVNCQNEKVKKQDMFRRYTTQKNQSNSEQNSVSDFTQSIFPQQLNHASNTQIQNIQLFNQQSLMTPPPKIVINSSNSKLNKSLENVDKIVELNKSQEQVSKNFSITQTNQYEIQSKSPINQKATISYSDISDEGFNLNTNEFVKDQKSITLPPSINLGLNKKSQQIEYSQEGDNVTQKEAEKIAGHDNINRKSVDASNNNQSIADDLLQSKQNPKNFYFSAKFIQNLDKCQKQGSNRKISIDLCDETKKNEKNIYDNPDFSAVNKKPSLDKNFQSLHHLNCQFSNIQLASASNTSINYNKQGTNNFSKQIIEIHEPNSDTLEIIHYELTQKEKQGNSKNQSNFILQSNDDQYFAQDSIITQVVSNQQNKEADKLSEDQMDQIIVVNDQKISGGILQYNKKVSSPVQKKKQLTFCANNEINNYGNLYDPTLESTITNSPNEKTQNNEKNNFSTNNSNNNYVNSLKYIQHSQKQIISPIKIVHQKTVKNDFKSIKLNGNFEMGQHKNQQNHQNSYLIQQQKPIVLEDSKSSDALMNTPSRFAISSAEDNQIRSQQMTNLSQNIQEFDGSIFMPESDQRYITPQLAPGISPTNEYDFLQLNNQELCNTSFLLRDKLLKNQNNIINSEISSQDHEVHKNQELLSYFDEPHSFRVNSEICIQPFQNKLKQPNQSYSPSYRREQDFSCSQKTIPTQFAKFKKQIQMSKPINNGQPVKQHYSERLIPINEFQNQFQHMFVKCKQNIANQQSDERNEQSCELSTPLRMKCFTLQDQISNTYQNQSQQDEMQGQIHQQIQRKIARKRTKSEFAVQNNIQEIKTALKNKICNCPDILIVDDTQMNRHTLKLIIQSKFPFTIDEATNGQEAVDKVEELINNQNHCLTYKMIFMDIDMPKLNGYEATNKINELFKKNNIFSPIIAHTAFNRSEVQEEMNQCNMIDYAGKPISTAIIEQLFARYIDVASITGEN